MISQMVTKLPQDTEQARKIVEYAKKVISDLKNVLFLDPEPSSMRSYARINDTELKVNASNLSAVLNKLCKKKKLSRLCWIRCGSCQKMKLQIFPLRKVL